MQGGPCPRPQLQEAVNRRPLSRRDLLKTIVAAPVLAVELDRAAQAAEAQPAPTAAASSCAACLGKAGCRF